MASFPVKKVAPQKAARRTFQF